MPKGAGALLIVGLVCLLLGGAVGSALRGGDGLAGTPDADSARLSDLEQQNERLRRELSEARLEIDTLRAPEPGDGHAGAVDIAPMVSVPEADPEPGAEESNSDRVQRAKDALPGLEYLLLASPTDRDLLAEYVNTAARAGLYDQAIAKLEELLKEHPDNPDLLTQLGRAYLVKTRVMPNLLDKGKLAYSALERFEVAIEKSPEHYESRFLRAITNYNMPPFMNKMGTVIKDFETLVEQSRVRGDSDRTANSFAWLARAYQKAGRAEDAKGAVRKGMELYPGNDDLSAMQERLAEGE